VNQWLDFSLNLNQWKSTEICWFKFRVQQELGLAICLYRYLKALKVPRKSRWNRWYSSGWPCLPVLSSTLNIVCSPMTPMSTFSSMPGLPHSHNAHLGGGGGAGNPGGAPAGGPLMAGGLSCGLQQPQQQPQQAQQQQRDSPSPFSCMRLAPSGPTAHYEPLGLSPYASGRPSPCGLSVGQAVPVAPTAYHSMAAHQYGSHSASSTGELHFYDALVFRIEKLEPGKCFHLGCRYIVENTVCISAELRPENV